MSEAAQSPPGAAGLVAALRGLGLVAADETPRLAPLTGGVSSDIVLVEAGGRRFCVKRALPRLKVAALWEAPVARNAAEAAWLRLVGGWLPGCAPAVLGEAADRGLFAMAYLPAADFPVWKTELLAGAADRGFAAAVGRRLGQIHGRSAGRADLAAAFAHDATFEAIRVEPYLRATARRHLDLAPWLDELAARTLRTKAALVHGDVSPKNILHGPGEPVFLDAECAWYGDPAFDLAFCLNHLLLKGARRPDRRAAFLACFAALAESYLAEVGWEDRAGLEERTATLLPALLLARIDGKSPVEYLTEAAVLDAVRQAARAMLLARPRRLAAVAAAWGEGS